MAERTAEEVEKILNDLPSYMIADVRGAVRARIAELLQGDEGVYSLDEAYCLAVVERDHAKYRLDVSKGRISQEECDRHVSQSILRNVPIKARWEGVVAQAQKGNVSLLKYMAPAPSESSEEIGDMNIVFTSAEE